MPTGRAANGSMPEPSPAAELINAAAQKDRSTFADRVAAASLEAAVDVWLRRVARRKLTSIQRSRLIAAVQRSTAAETKDIQLTHAALLRAAGLDERPAAAAAAAAGATYREIAAILGMTQQGANKRIRSWHWAAGDTAADKALP